MTDGYKDATGNTWKPENKGDFVEGLLVKVEENIGPNESTMYHIEQIGTGERIRVWGSTVLDQRMSEVRVGQQVKITFEGLAEKGGRGKNKPKLWRVQYKSVDSYNKAKDEFSVPDEDLE